MCNSKNIIFLFLFHFLNLFFISYELIEDPNEITYENQTFINPPGFSRISGFYPENFKLKLSSKENTTIYYTDDSSDPKNSTTVKEYKDYILIYDKSQEANIYSEIRKITFSGFNPPNYPLDKAMIIRAVAKNSNGEFSEVNSKTYFITTGDLYKYQDLTVISIVTNPMNLFDPDYGIYVSGTMHEVSSNKANYKMKGRDWERESFVTIFEKGEIILQQNLGIRIKGTATRKSPGKSFNLYARKDYGKSKIEIDLIKDNYDINGNLITKYKSFSLKNIFEEGRLRDKFGKDLFYLREGITSINMRNSILFLNGEYWGFYLIQEKLDDNFISNNYLIPKDNVVIAKNNYIEDGIVEVYNDFRDFCKNYSQKDLADEKIYEEIKNKIDLDSLIELFATNLYILNLDWPARNDGEWRYFGDFQEGNKYFDGKWRFIIFDLDYTMGAEFQGVGSPDVDTFPNLAKREKLKQPPVDLFYGLLVNNTDFQNKFVNIYCDYANDVYNLEKIKELIEKYRDEYSDLMANSLLRWSEQKFDSILEGYTYYKLRFSKDLDSVYDFFEQRPKYTFQHMKEFLKLKGDLVELIVEIKGKGRIKINSISPKFGNGIWTGKYFTRIPIKIKAISEPGYEFKNWDGYHQSNQKDIEIILFESQKITANFE